jgi:hypothetical protein
MSLPIEPELVLFPEDDTPYLPVGSITISAPDLLRGLVAVIHAAATDEDHPILKSVAIRPDAMETVRLVAADNYRIAGAWADLLPIAIDDAKRLVTVLKSLPTIKAETCMAQVTLSLGRMVTEGDWAPPRRLDAFVEDVVPIARLKLRVIDGAYPDYARIIPPDPGYVGAFNGLFLSEAAKFASGFDPKAGGIVRQFQSADGATGAFMFRSGRMTEVVMPVKTGEITEGTVGPS